MPAGSSRRPGPRERSFFFALIATAGGVATAVASAAGGGVVRFLPAQLFGKPLVAAQFLFLAGGAARVIALVLAFRIEERTVAGVAPRASAAPREKLAA